MSRSDEFAVTIHNTKKDYIVSLANSTKDKTLEMIEEDKKLRPLGVGVSIGISLTTGKIINMGVIYKAADLALYRAKKSQQEKVNIDHGSVG